MIKKKISIILVVILSIGVLQAGIIVAFSMKGINFGINSGKTSEKTVQMNQGTDSQPISERDLPEPKKKAKKTIDIKGIKVANEIEEHIRSMDKSNAKKNIENYKKLIAEFDVPDKFREGIEKIFKKGHMVPDVLTAYDFLYQNYGQFNELEILIRKYESCKDWSTVFKEYEDNNEEFVPRNYESGYLEKLMNTPGITADDVMISDRLSQKGIKPFEEVISMRKQGKNWKNIKTELGVINVSDKIPSVSISKSQVEKYMKEDELSEKAVRSALILAGKLGEDDDLAINNRKKGRGAEEVYNQFYKRKYR